MINAFLVGLSNLFLTFGLVLFGGFCFYLEYQERSIKKEVEEND